MLEYVLFCIKIKCKFALKRLLTIDGKTASCTLQCQNYRESWFKYTMGFMDLFMLYIFNIYSYFINVNI